MFTNWWYWSDRYSPVILLGSLAVWIVGGWIAGEHSFILTLCVVGILTSLCLLNAVVVLVESLAYERQRERAKRLSGDQPNRKVWTTLGEGEFDHLTYDHYDMKTTVFLVDGRSFIIPGRHRSWRRGTHVIIRHDRFDGQLTRVR